MRLLKHAHPSDGVEEGVLDKLPRLRALSWVVRNAQLNHLPQLACHLLQRSGLDALASISIKEHRG